MTLVLLGWPALALAQDPGQEEGERDCSDPVSQAEMTDCAFLDSEDADAALNAAYAEALDRARARDAALAEGEVTSEEMLRKAQRAWIAFRDAACAAESTTRRGGTMQSQVLYTCIARLTRSRNEDLHIFSAEY
ncbi:lysozyme inhibitor LprI family protein [Pseudoroseicyclus aestuarii]|uniref:Uncharacterized protein YecT (DUF1311 family) n=1 Tax=Pseudoroseicyclus aestuarii TaxID=1795041 RepID=A0A318SQD7_9RHOB|nr:lysozyme inhibitor LprI family protein [Pseudoroseicyclus aestuarii]PYE84091.1 uncharacterized protein YecT (DUF1311 family) [Pseudoroseicyclus aestuarii]